MPQDDHQVIELVYKAISGVPFSLVILLSRPSYFTCMHTIEFRR